MAWHAEGKPQTLRPSASAAQLRRVGAHAGARSRMLFGMPLPEGVYEHLVTEALARELDELAPARALIEELDDRDIAV